MWLQLASFESHRVRRILYKVCGMGIEGVLPGKRALDGDGLQQREQGQPRPFRRRSRGAIDVYGLHETVRMCYELCE